MRRVLSASLPFLGVVCLVYSVSLFRSVVDLHLDSRAQVPINPSAPTIPNPTSLFRFDPVASKNKFNAACLTFHTTQLDASRDEQLPIKCANHPEWSLLVEGGLAIQGGSKRVRVGSLHASTTLRTQGPPVKVVVKQHAPDKMTHFQGQATTLMVSQRRLLGVDQTDASRRVSPPEVVHISPETSIAATRLSPGRSISSSRVSLVAAGLLPDKLPTSPNDVARGQQPVSDAANSEASSSGGSLPVVSASNKLVSSPTGTSQVASSPNSSASPTNKLTSPPNKLTSAPNKLTSTPNKLTSPPNKLMSPPNGSPQVVSPRNKSVSPPNGSSPMASPPHKPPPGVPTPPNKQHITTPRQPPSSPTPITSTTESSVDLPPSYIPMTENFLQSMGFNTQDASLDDIRSRNCGWMDTFKCKLATVVAPLADMDKDSFLSRREEWDYFFRLAAQLTSGTSIGQLPFERTFRYWSVCADGACRVPREVAILFGCALSVTTPKMTMYTSSPWYRYLCAQPASRYGECATTDDLDGGLSPSSFRCFYDAVWRDSYNSDIHRQVDEWGAFRKQFDPAADFHAQVFGTCEHAGTNELLIVQEHGMALDEYLARVARKRQLAFGNGYVVPSDGLLRMEIANKVVAFLHKLVLGGASRDASTTTTVMCDVHMGQFVMADAAPDTEENVSVDKMGVKLVDLDSIYHVKGAAYDQDAGVLHDTPVMCQHDSHCFPVYDCKTRCVAGKCVLAKTPEETMVEVFCRDVLECLVPRLCDGLGDRATLADLHKVAHAELKSGRYG